MGYRFGVDPIDVAPGAETLIEALRLVVYLPERIKTDRGSEYRFTGTKRPEPFVPMLLMARFLGGDKSACYVEVRGEADDDVGEYHLDETGLIVGSGREKSSIRSETRFLAAMVEFYLAPFKQWEREKKVTEAEVKAVIDHELQACQLVGEAPAERTLARDVWVALETAELEPLVTGMHERFKERLGVLKGLGITSVPSSVEAFVRASDGVW